MAEQKRIDTSSSDEHHDSSKVGKSTLRVKSKQNEFRDKLLGGTLEFIPTSKLPTNRVVLHRARYLRTDSNINRSVSPVGDISDKDIAKTIANEIDDIWEKAALPHIRIDYIQKHVHKLMDKLNGLMKNWSRLTQDKEPLMSFSKSLDELFDISYKDLQYRLSTSGNPQWKEDFQFYLDQKRVPQVGSMIGKDKLFEARQKRREERLQQIQTRKEKADRESTQTVEVNLDVDE